MYVKAAVTLTCSYDSEADAAKVYLDAEGHVLGLEIIGAREQLPTALLRAILDAGTSA
ncbi:hypothetical protein [Asanoa sp. NPDC050611]|uniref:hypothetical protein n=1 Tax=Asanoa sp. NPDC050611 TaxID=3157098 RepID=UPI0033E9B58C